MSLGEMRLRALDHRRAGLREVLALHRDTRVASVDARALKRLLWQVEATDGGVFIEVAQDVGELQCTAEMMGQLLARLVLHAEDAHRKSADRACHAIAVAIE